MKCIAVFSSIMCLSMFSAAQASDCIKPNNQCTPVVGCILGTPNELFFGEVHGVTKGKFSVRSNAGASCVGTFKRTVFGAAKVRTTCDDGRTGRAAFTYQHELTGTGRGKGRMSDGERIVFWAGDNMWSYFDDLLASRSNELVACAMNALSLSAANLKSLRPKR